MLRERRHWGQAFRTLAGITIFHQTAKIKFVEKKLENFEIDSLSRAISDGQNQLAIGISQGLSLDFLYCYARYQHWCCCDLFREILIDIATTDYQIQMESAHEAVDGFLRALDVKGSASDHELLEFLFVEIATCDSTESIQHEIGIGSTLMSRIREALLQESDVEYSVDKTYAQVLLNLSRLVKDSKWGLYVRKLQFHNIDQRLSAPVAQQMFSALIEIGSQPEVRWEDSSRFRKLKECGLIYSIKVRNHFFAKLTIPGQELVAEAVVSNWDTQRSFGEESPIFLKKFLKNLQQNSPTTFRESISTSSFLMSQAKAHRLL